MSHTLETVLQDVERDLRYHSEQLLNYPEYSQDWNFHLGWTDALSSIRWKLKAIEQE